MAWGTATRTEIVVYVPELLTLTSEGYTHLDIDQDESVTGIALVGSSLVYRTDIDSSASYFRWRFRNETPNPQTTTDWSLTLPIKGRARDARRTPAGSGRANRFHGRTVRPYERRLGDLT